MIYACHIWKWSNTVWCYTVLQSFEKDMISRAYRKARCADVQQHDKRLFVSSFRDKQSCLNIVGVWWKVIKLKLKLLLFFYNLFFAAVMSKKKCNYVPPIGVQITGLSFLSPYVLLGSVGFCLLYDPSSLWHFISYPTINGVLPERHNRTGVLVYSYCKWMWACTAVLPHCSSGWGKFLPLFLFLFFFYDS